MSDFLILSSLWDGLSKFLGPLIQQSAPVEENKEHIDYESDIILVKMKPAKANTDAFRHKYGNFNKVRSHQ